MADLTGNPALDNAPIGDLAHDAPPATTTNPALGPDAATIGADTPPPSILSRSWQSIVGGAPTLMAPHVPGSSGPQPVVNQPIEDTITPGVVRGARDFWDKITENPNPEYGYTPSDADLAKIKQQNATDRAAWDKQYGGDTAAQGARVVGNVFGTAPFIGPLGEAVNVGVKALPFVATGARGLPGIAERAVERATTGGIMGGTQAGATSDPSQPLAPQVGTGAEWGAGLGVGAGAVLDTISNAIKRLTGGVLRTNPYTGQLSDEVVARAQNAQLLQKEGVPIQASQVSNDPYLQFSNKYGSQVPGSGTGDFIDNQAQRFRNAALQRVEPGTPSSVVTPDFITNNDNRIDGMYANSVRAVPTVPSIGPSGLPIDREFGRIRQTIPQSLTPEAQAQINGAMNDVSDVFRAGGGQITGDDAQRLTRRTNSTISPLLNSDNADVRNYGMQIRDQINQRLRAQMTQPQQDMFDQANNQFRSLRTVENAADSTGSFQPGQLYTETKKVADKFNSPGALDGIARAGDSVIQPALDARSASGPRAAGAASPFGAALITSGLVKPFVDMATSGGVGTATGLGMAGLNRGVQAMNRYGGPRAIDAALSGGGSPVMDIQRALDLLRMPVVASATQPQPQPFPYTNPNP